MFPFGAPVDETSEPWLSGWLKGCVHDLGYRSTSKQGEKDLSIPAQLRTLRRVSSERGWLIAGTFSDVASGTSIRGRAGPLAGIETACQLGQERHAVDQLTS